MSTHDKALYKFSNSLLYLRRKLLSRCSLSMFLLYSLKQLSSSSSSSSGGGGRIRYDTRCYFNVRSKADTSQLKSTARKRQLIIVKQKN